LYSARRAPAGTEPEAEAGAEAEGRDEVPYPPQQETPAGGRGSRKDWFEAKRYRTA